MENLTNLADRLKAKLEGSKNLVAADQDMVELMDAHLDVVSAAHGSIHGSVGKKNEQRAE